MLETLSRMFLIFLIDSFLGWGLETVWCSAHEKRFVRRGFLYGPICPIYGVGGLIMTEGLSSLSWNPVLLFFAAMVILSAWEYLVAWFLETTTGIKYWDYSAYPLNFKGRICLMVSMFWGLLAVGFVYGIIPLLRGAMAMLTGMPLVVASGCFAAALLVDLIFTIRSLALMTRFVRLLNQTSDELRAKLAALPEAAGEKLSALPGAASVRELMEAIPTASDMTAELRARRDALMEKASRYSRRWMRSYPHLSSKKYGKSLDELRTKLREKLEAVKSR